MAINQECWEQAQGQTHPMMARLFHESPNLSRSSIDSFNIFIVKSYEIVTGMPFNKRRSLTKTLVLAHF
jgi:hypothetical protein